MTMAMRHSATAVASLLRSSAAIARRPHLFALRVGPARSALAAPLLSLRVCARAFRGVRLCGGAVPASRRRLGGVRAAQVNESGSIDSPMIQSMEKKIKEQLNADTVIVKDAYGDGRHVSIYVVSSEFEGQSAVNRQRMVYKAIWEELQNTVHAVDQMTTRTPTEAAGGQ